MSFEISWYKNGIVTNWSGTASSKEIIQFLNEIQSSPNFDYLRFSLHDYTQCDEIKFDPDDMDYVGALDAAGAASNPNIKVGIVAQNPELLEMVNNYKRLKLTPYETKIFDNLNDAAQWLIAKGYKLDFSY